MSATRTGAPPPVEALILPMQQRPDELFPLVLAVLYKPLPGARLTMMLADHTRVCGHHHRHMTRNLAEDDLIRTPPCRTGPYRLAVTVATTPSAGGAR
jgi:hypothetical protein